MDKNQVVPPINQPADLSLGDYVELSDPFSGDQIAGQITYLHIPEDPGCSEIWSDIRLQIVDDGGAYHSFHTQLLSSAPSYWIGGDPEGEATPQEKGCYSLKRA